MTAPVVPAVEEAEESKLIQQSSPALFLDQETIVPFDNHIAIHYKPDT